MKKIMIIHPEGNLNNNPNLTGMVEILCENGYLVDIYSREIPSISQTAPCTGARFVLNELPDRFDFTAIIPAAQFNDAETLTGYISDHIPSYDLIIGVDRGIIEAGIIAGIQKVPYGLISYELLFTEETGPEFKELDVRFSRNISFAVCQDKVRSHHLSVEYDIPADKIIHIPVAGRGVRRGEKSFQLHDTLGLDRSKKIALYIGCVHSNWAGIHELLASAKSWDDSWALVLHHRYAEYGEDFIAHIQTIGNVYISPFKEVALNDLHLLLNAADLGIGFYVPQFQSNCFSDRNNLMYIGMASGKIATYLQHGIPIVINGIGEMSEHVKASGLGIVAEPIGTMPALLAATSRKILDRQKVNCFRFFEEKLDLNKTVTVLLDTIKRLLYDSPASGISAPTLAPAASGTEDIAQDAGFCRPLVIAANLVPFSDPGRLERQDMCVHSIASIPGEELTRLNICFPDEVLQPDGWVTATGLTRSADRELGVAGKRKPFVVDLFNSAAEWAQQHGLEWFALTNSDIVFTRQLVREINRCMAAGVDTIAVSRNEVAGMDPAGNLIAGELVINGYDVFFCRTDWWRSHHRLFQPYIFGERAWDNAYAAVMAGSSRFRLLCTGGLCFHFPHATDWLNPGPYADYNLGIYLGVDRPHQERFSAFIKQVSAVPRQELTGERMEEIVSRHFPQKQQSSDIQIMKRHAAPGISIVTPSFNQAEFLEECMDSILSQNYPNLEYIVMDGGSSDGSVEIIKKYEKYLSHWQSRPDGGQYRAVNDGFKRSTGEIMAWLNSDDKYHSAALSIVSETFSRRPGTEWLMGRPTVWNGQGELTLVLDHLPSWARDNYLRGEIGPPHIQQESTFWRRSLWDKAGGTLAVDLRLAGDMELWSRFFRHAQLYTVDAMLGGFRSHAAQKSANFMNQYNEEAARVIDRERRLFSASGQSGLLPAPPPVSLEDVLAGSDLTPAPGTFDLFTYSRKAHFSLFHQHARQLFGDEIDENLCDLKAYQDLLVYSYITANIPKGSRILEIGGGDSRVLRAIADEYECWNLDKLEGIGNGPTAVSPAGYKVVRDYIGAFSLELPDSYFDLVFSISVLEHITEDQETFSAIRRDMDRLMKPGAFSLHCFDLILQQDSVWTNSLLHDLFAHIATINSFVPLHHLSQDPTLYVMTEKAYCAHWKEVTKVSYREFGSPLSYNILWEKPAGTVTEARTPAVADDEQYAVSVLVSTYNSAGFIRECLEDLVAQTICDRIEIIVIDAASPQDERSIVAEFQKKHSNITYVRTGSRIGVYPAWNMAVRLARGKYITPFSTNDRLRKDAYEIMVDALENNSRAALVYGDSYHTKIPHETFEKHTLCGAFQWPDYSYQDLLTNCMIGPHPMWRRSVHETVGLFDESFTALGDQDFFIRVGARYDMLHIREFTGLYWLSDDGLSNRSELFVPEIQRIRLRYSSATAVADLGAAQQAAAADPGDGADRDGIERLKTLAAAKKEEKQYVDAFNLFLQARSQGDLSVLADLGDCLANQSRLDEAAGYYLEALRLDSDNAQAHLGIGVQKLVTGRYSEAAISFSKALKSKPGDTKALCGLGMTRSAQGRRPEGLDLFKKSLDSEPDNQTALHELLKTAYELDRLADAEPYLEGYLRYHPADCNILFSLAGLRYRLQNYTGALDALERVLAFDPGYEGGPELYDQIRDVVAATDHDARAETYLKRCKQANELARERKTLEAEKLYRELLAEAPEDGSALIGMGVLKLMSGNNSEAAISFSKALRFSPKEVKAICGLGMSRSAQGRVEEGFKLFMSALDMEPENLTALHELLKAAYNLDRLDEAETYLLKYLALHPADSHLLYSLAGLRYRMGNYAEALEVLDRLLALQPDYEGGAELAQQIGTTLSEGDAQLRQAAAA